MNKFTVAENLAIFLIDNVGSVLGQWQGRMSAKDQRGLFGQFLGKGKITIDGGDEILKHTIKVCFGQDWDDTFNKKWSQL